MAIRITSVTRVNGPACDHVDVVANVEGVTRTRRSSFAEIDALFADLTLGERIEMLCLLWAWYRRLRGRAVVNVDIA